jgi:hypothetical protein
VLPSGEQHTPSVNMRYRDTTRAVSRIDRAYEASSRYLDSIT